ncbi:Holliday junction resolvase RecU [Caldifermentibacillus hisashii]|uniref:Holliday junction resolvase RecU n=1 Tax=Caldifermentibacillus hisashii TaxID=996558 RepID=A0ABU9K2X0_9BACI
MKLAKKQNIGKIFESEIEKSCKDQHVFYFRVRDVNIPPDLRTRIRLPQNKYDSLMFYHNHLFTLEFKATEKAKSFPLKEHVIKQHQIDNLKAAKDYDGVISGFIFNFRDTNNETYFVEIDDFINYINIAQNGLEHTYKSKVNEKSIPIGIIREIGIPVKSIKKQVRYRFYINILLDELIKKYYK